MVRQKVILLNNGEQESHFTQTMRHLRMKSRNYTGEQENHAPQEAEPCSPKNEE